MSNFRPIDRETGFLLPPSVDEWLPEKHLARFVVEVVEGLDLRAMSGGYRGSGSASYHPRMLLGLLVYGYATGVFSSRKLERATYDSVAFRFIAANDHPDHGLPMISRRLCKAASALPLLHRITRSSRRLAPISGPFVATESFWERIRNHLRSDARISRLEGYRVSRQRSGPYSLQPAFQVRQATLASGPCFRPVI